MTKQLDFELRERKTRARRGPQLARRMIAILEVKRCWVTRAELGMAHKLTPRECRLGRQCAHGRIIYGTFGFKLTKCATPEEIRKCSGALLGQIQAMQKEYSQLTRRAHRALAEKGALA